MPKNPKNVVWLAYHHEQDDYIYVGLNSRAVTAYVKPHKKGLHLQVNYHGKGAFAHSTAADLSIFDGLISSEEKPSKKHPESYIIPGEYTLREVVRFIRLKTGDNGWFIAGYFHNENAKKRKNITRASVLREKELSEALQKSGIWAKRGKLNWKDCPKDFFKFVPLTMFTSGNTYSYRQWWIQYLTTKVCGTKQISLKAGDNAPYPHDFDDATRQHLKTLTEKYQAKLEQQKESNRFAYQRYAEYLLSREVVKYEIGKNMYPEIPSAVRGWNKLTLSLYLKFLQNQLITQKRWPMFIANVYEHFYESFMTKHHEWCTKRNFDMAVEYLNSCPKNKNFIESLNNFVNSGARVEDVCKLNLRTANALTDAARWMREIAKLRNSKHILNKSYNPPEIELEEGYEWATFETFSGLSNKYSCCISNAGYYEKAMCNGLGHVIYRPDHRTNGGALAFIAFGKNAISWYGAEKEVEADAKWRIHEIRSYANGNVNAVFQAQIQSYVDKMNELEMGRSPIVPQGNAQNDFKAQVLADPVGRKVAELYPQYFPELRQDVALDAEGNLALPDGDYRALEQRIFAGA